MNKQIQVGLFFVIFLLLVTLKFTVLTTLSWWIVTIPLWGPFVAFATFLLLVALTIGMRYFSDWVFKK